MVFHQVLVGFSHSFDSVSSNVNVIYFLFLSFGLVCEGTYVNSLCFSFSSDADTIDCLMGFSTEK